MDWFASPEYWMARFLFQRGLALIYLIAFLVALSQFRPLLGERGLLPVRNFLEFTTFRASPSIFHWRYSDRLLVALCWAGILLSLGALATISDRGPIWLSLLVWFSLWALYLSIVNVGQTFYGFGWESLLLEAGFLGIFLGPSYVAPPVLMIYLLRWLLFRVEFGAGLIKMRGDPCWRSFTCLYYHHETQPMPNPLSRYFHNLPRRLHRIEVMGNHFAQLVAPLFLFLPQPICGIAGLIMIATQLWLVLSGNFSWLNLITIILGLAALDNGWFAGAASIVPAHLQPAPLWFEIIIILAFALIVVLSWWPVRNMASPGQYMNASFNSLHLVNTYGAFGSVTRVRNEIVIEGTSDEVISTATMWREYEFKGKPGNVMRRPRQFAPYHLRLDWLMWFAALSPSYAGGWFVPLLLRLLENDKSTLKLLAANPFPETPPRYIRALLYRYRFTTRAERRQTGAVWVRQLAGEYARPISRRD